MSTSNLKNPLVIRQGNVQDWSNGRWPIIDNSVVSPNSRLSKELLKLKIFPLQVKNWNTVMTIIFYKWFQRGYKSKRQRLYHKKLRKNLNRRSKKKKFFYFNFLRRNDNYCLYTKQKRQKKRKNYLFYRSKKRKHLLYRKNVKKFYRRFYHPSYYSKSFDFRRQKNQASINTKQRIINAKFKVTKVIPQLTRKKKLVKKQKYILNNKKFKILKRKFFYLNKANSFLAIKNKKLFLLSTPLWILKQLYQTYLSNVAIALKKKRILKGKAYLKFSKRKDLFYRIFTRWKRKSKRPVIKKKPKRLKKLHRQNNKKRSLISIRKSRFVNKKRKNRLKVFFKKNARLVRKAWKKPRSVKPAVIFKRGFKSGNKKGRIKKYERIVAKPFRLENGTVRQWQKNKQFRKFYPIKKPWWWWKRKGLKKPKKYAYRRRWTPHWMRRISVGKRAVRFPRRLLTKKILLYNRRFYRVWYRRVIYLKTRRKLWQNRFIKFRNNCQRVTTYSIPSLVVWNLSSTFLQLDNGITSMKLINIFNTSTAVRNLSYLALIKNTDINTFLRSIKFLKYSVDAVLLHLLILTKHSNSNVISYLVAEMLARNAAKKKQRALINILRKIQKVVGTYARRYCLRWLVNPVILRIKITGKLAGSLRTRNYFVGPRHLPLHTIAHTVEVSQAMVNTKYGIFTVRVWCW